MAARGSEACNVGDSVCVGLNANSSRPYAGGERIPQDQDALRRAVVQLQGVCWLQRVLCASAPLQTRWGCGHRGIFLPTMTIWMVIAGTYFAQACRNSQNSGTRSGSASYAGISRNDVGGVHGARICTQ